MMKHGSAGSGRNSQENDNREDSQGVDTDPEQRPEPGVGEIDEVDERRKKHQRENSPARKLDLPDPPDPDNLPINYPVARKLPRPHGIEWP
ncbi:MULTISPECIES: hypothetical protein [Arthrobacter]|uniref:Uncharacterized protein n=1 Tax=Arthrobacter terricola TaxID=2547396 RepID=A0A4R5KRQ9_9MICC|nr:MULTISPECIES: hypothetical protein [Arthrobacter]MBT8160522.1 hypothetical protein [Arthrobacter sp. GN70]TDF98441.1 hypothetical protein E1809_06605 [Arthrobacter terricola]